MPKRTRDYRAGLLTALSNPQEAVAYLNAALEDSDEMFLLALRDVAEARQVSKVAVGAGVQRESLYRMLSAKGNPRYSSFSGILRSLGLQLSVGQRAEPRPSTGLPTRGPIDTSAAQARLEQAPAAAASRGELRQPYSIGWLPTAGPVAGVLGRQYA